MQFGLLTNFAPSKSAGDRSGAAPEFGLQNSRSSRLFFIGAVVRVENDGVVRVFILYKTNDPVRDVDFTPVLWDRFVPLVFENR